MEFRSRNLSEFADIAKSFASSLSARERGARIVTLHGPLGAGKTTFVRALADFFGIEESVTSPTFVLEKIYVAKRGPFKRLVHVDAYRLKDVGELEALRWHDVIRDRDTIILLEWPEHVHGAIPENATRVEITPRGDERIISY